MAYEPFKRKTVRVDIPALAVAPDGRMALNAASARLFKRAGVVAVKILWDGTNYGIALQAAGKDDPDSYSISFAEGYNSATFAAKAFLRHIGWRATTRQTVPATWNGELKMLEAFLSSQFVVGTREQKEAKRKTKTGR